MGPKPPNSSQGFACDRRGCSVKTKGVIVKHLTNTAMLAEDCHQADVIVVSYVMPSLCSFLPPVERPLEIDRSAFES